jgi:catechol 2,3-dioxygenase-like lactoylglutathione lyase family enzyme
VQANLGAHGRLSSISAVTTFNHVGHCVTDLARSRRFYEEVLGFVRQHDLPVPDEAASKLLRVPAPVGLTAAYLALDGFTLELIHFDRDGNEPRRDRSFTEPGLTHLSFSVDDVRAVCAKARELGGEVLEDTDVGGRAILIRDPDGQILELLPARRP